MSFTSLYITPYLVFHSFIICDVVSVFVISFVMPLEKPPSYKRKCKAGFPVKCRKKVP